MRAKHLIEADYDFSQHAGGVLDKVSKLAGGAYGKFKSAYQAAKAEQKAAAKKAEKDGKEPVEDLVTSAANLVLKTDHATPDDIRALNLDASELQDLLNTVKEFSSHMAKTPAIFKKAILASNLPLTPDQKQELDERLGAQQDPSGIGEQKLNKNKSGEQDTWHMILVSRDPTEIGKAFVTALRKTQDENAKYNMGIHGQQFKQGERPKLRPEGMGIINVMSAERQAVEARIKDVLTMIAEVEKHPQAPVAESIQRLAARAKKRL